MDAAWIGKCEEFGSALYSKVLGARTKVSGSLNDLKAEKVRYESAAVYKEKLRWIGRIVFMRDLQDDSLLDLSYTTRAALQEMSFLRGRPGIRLYFSAELILSVAQLSGTIVGGPEVLPRVKARDAIDARRIFRA